MMQIVREGRVFCSKYPTAPATFFAEARIIVRREGSNAASQSLPSDTPRRKKVSRDERRALVESFVTRYRSMNAGKFPSVTAAWKEVGGSYYVVRNIFQELEYESKVCSSNSSYGNVSGNVVNKEDKSFSVVEVVSTAVGLQDGTCTEALDDVKMLDTNEKQLEADRVLQAYTSAGETFSEVDLVPQTPGSHHDFVLEENSLLKGDAKSLEEQKDDKVEDAAMDNCDEFLTFLDKQKIAEASQGVQSDFGVVEGDLLKDETEIESAEGDEKEQTVSKELPNSGSPELKTEHHQQLPEEENTVRDLSTEQSDDAESSKKSSLWGNLKSFAVGIVNIWRKL